MKRPNYCNRLVWFTLCVIIGTIGLGFIPSFNLCGMATERVDILSELRPRVAAVESHEYEIDMERHEAELAQMEAIKEEIDTLPIYKFTFDQHAEAERAARHIAMSEPDSTRCVIPIEDFYADSMAVNFAAFISKMVRGEDVRIAFMGDSFVEGDILTSDLREGLQQLFGGRGVGFVHCDIPFTTARRTINRRVSGWSAYSVMTPRNNPAAINEQFFISGYLAKGGRGATARWATTDAFEHIDSCTRARILFISRDSSRLEVMLNDDETQTHEFDVAGNILPQQILIEAPVEALRLKVLEGEITCYGTSLEGNGGVIVDNLSMRSNSGHAIFGTSTMVNRQIDTMLGYDLVVLQYGLNIMQPGQRRFTTYHTKLCEIIDYVRSNFPNAAILVLGVSDRWVRNEESGHYEPIGSVDALTSYQRAAADSCNVAFWNTSEAMALHGGMPGFVRNGWAANDYTHINFAGGRRVAAELTFALHTYAYNLMMSGRVHQESAATIARYEPIHSNYSAISWGIQAPRAITAMETTTTHNATEEADSTAIVTVEPTNHESDIVEEATEDEPEEDLNDEISSTDEAETEDDTEDEAITTTEL